MNNKDTVVTRILHTPAGLRVREAGDGGESRTITGYAILFDTPSDVMFEDEEEEVREVISRGAVTQELLDGSDIKMTMFHDPQLILARSKRGKGTLRYTLDEKGVSFEFDAPRTVDGDKALELVARGDISGCSFMFATRYYDTGFVAREVERVNGKTQITYRVNAITGIYDFTLTPDPAYSATGCEVRELEEEFRRQSAPPESQNDQEKIMREQLREMRRTAAQKM